MTGLRYIISSWIEWIEASVEIDIGPGRVPRPGDSRFGMGYRRKGSVGLLLRRKEPEAVVHGGIQRSCQIPEDDGVV